MHFYQVDPGLDPSDETNDRSRWYTSLKDARKMAAKFRRAGEEDVEIAKHDVRPDLARRPKELALRILNGRGWAFRIETIVDGFRASGRT